ncbi:hypothetical protein AB1Y20_004425 [Prymnesium parvum]
MRQALVWAKENSMVVGVVVGALVVMYGFYRFSVRVMRFFFNVSDKEIFTGGFVLGMLAMLGLLATVAYAHRRYSLNVEHVYRSALAELRKHESVSKAMGGFWHPANFKGFAIESLQEAIQGSERRARSSYLEAPARRIQMIFTLKGMGRTGMVSLEAFKRSGDLHFDMLALDVKETDEHLILEGEHDHELFPEVNNLLEANRSANRSTRRA